MKRLLILSVLLAGCGVVATEDVSKPVPDETPAKAVIMAYSQGCSDAFDKAAMELDTKQDLALVHDDLRDNLKRVRMNSFKPIDERLESVGAGDEPDLKKVSELFRKLAEEFRSVK